jgi:DNA polymerase V
MYTYHNGGENMKGLDSCEIAVSSIDSILKWAIDKSYQLPFYECSISAGLPSDVSSCFEKVDIHKMLVKHPSATFFVRVSGHSMTKAGIFDNDILLVDRSLSPIHGKVVIAIINGQFTVRRLWKSDSRVLLVAENKGYPVQEITDDMDLHIWGVVSNVIHKF